ncbi:MAG TPA: TMEM175 family protein [Bacteroidota bacterium]|nr:TMEM175 family protein [Bacteroidota bacterium]
MPDHPTPHGATAISKARLEFLYDGIFAIAMTILVLELKVPDLQDHRSIGELLGALRHQGSTFFSYGLSLTMLGMFWYRHNRQYGHFRFITRSMLVLQLLQLGFAAFFPFCAALWGRYPTNNLSTLLYIGCIMAHQWCSLAQWAAANRAGAIEGDSVDATYKAIRKRNLVGSIILTAFFAYYLVQVLG